MGTRNLTLVVKDGKFKVAQYCQWDGYPSGQGIMAFNFIKDTLKADTLDRFKERIDSVKELTDEEVKQRWEAEGADNSGSVDMVVAEKFKKRNAHLDRDMGASILYYIAETEQPEVQLGTDFAADSLFCEWAYVLDLDRNVLEVYKGFNKEPLPALARFKYLEATRKPDRNGKPEEFYPIRLFAEFPFEDIKSKWESASWLVYVNELAYGADGD